MSEGRPEPVPVERLGYAEASAELDEIVAFFESREVDVDRLVERLARAAAIVDELDRRLRRTRLQVEELVPRLAAMSRSHEGAGVDADDPSDGALAEDEGSLAGEAVGEEEPNGE